MFFGWFCCSDWLENESSALFLQELKVNHISLPHNSCQPYSQVLVLGTSKWVRSLHLHQWMLHPTLCTEEQILRRKLLLPVQIPGLFSDLNSSSASEGWLRELRIFLQDYFFLVCFSINMERTSQFLMGQHLSRYLLCWKLDTERIQNQNYKNIKFTIKTIIVWHCCWEMGNLIQHSQHTKINAVSGKMSSAITGKI